jgi:hypothetical protein
MRDDTYFIFPKHTSHDSSKYCLRINESIHDCYFYERRHHVDTTIHATQWCPLCHVNLYHDIESCSDFTTVSREYGHPSWNSTYHLCNYIQGFVTEFVLPFQTKYATYLQLSKECIETAMGQYITDRTEISSEDDTFDEHDELALRDTERILNFLYSWKDNPHVIIMYEST